MNFTMTKVGKTQLFIIAMLFWYSHNVVGQVTLPWTEDFENATGAAYANNQAPIPGLSGTGYSWECVLGASGRLRTNAGAGFYHGGNRAITLDKSPSGGSAISNFLIGNIDLSTYAASNDLELTFWYSHHGEENHADDRMWMRGSSSDPWIEAYNLYANRPATGQYAQVTLDIDNIISTNGQTITSTFQIRFGQQDNFQATSPNASDGFSFDDVSITGTLPLPNNAGISAMLSPTLGIAPGPHSVDVTLNNYGINNIDTVTIEWEIGGTPQTAVTFVGPSLAPSTSTTVNLSPNTNFNAGVTNLKFWTSNPNNQLDPDNANDTLYAFICTGLSGTYTVGQPTSDFPTIADALTALYGCGVSGPVTMEVQGGVYLIPLVIDQPIPGISATNRVTFDGSNQTANIVIGTGPNITLDGANYITIQNFRLQNNSTSSGRGVWLTNGADYNEIIGNRIEMAVTNAFNTAGIVASASSTSPSGSGNNANYNLVENNEITGADRGISFYGSFTVSQYNNGNVIKGNNISDADNYGIYVYYQDSIAIDGNYVHDLPSTFHYGIYGVSLMNYDITANDVRVQDNGIYTSRTNSQTGPARRGLVANNMVQTVDDRGVYMFFCRSTDFYHNTIVSGASASVWSNFDNTVDIKNNIFVSTSLSDFAFEALSTTQLMDMNYNAFYKDPNNPNLIDYGPTYSDLADWQANGPYGFDANSIEGMPQFVSATDLHLTGYFLNDAGTPTHVTVDFDGDTRPAAVATSVDIGADEFTPPSNDAGVLDLAAPSLPITGGFSPVTITVRNYGIAPLATFNVEWEINGVAQAAVPYIGSPIPVAGTTTMNLANINFPANLTSLRFWTTMPNGVMDENTSNDTLELSLCPGLAGTYTVGHPSSDFPTVTEAIDALQTCGINGPVVMEFQPGTYNGSITLQEVPGASATNTVTFDGLDPNTTTLEHTGFGVGTAATIILDGADYITIKNFTIANTGINTAYGVLFTKGANYNVIEDNIVAMQLSVGLTNVVGVVASAAYDASTGATTEGNNANWNIIRRNDISGGEAGVILEGGVANLENVGNQILENTIHHVENFAIFVDEQDSFAVNGNVIRDLYANTSDGIVLRDVHHYTVIANNVTSRDEGIDIRGGFGAGEQAREGIIANNMCTTDGDALYMEDVITSYVYYNTLDGARAFFLRDHGNIDVRNNIFSGSNFGFNSPTNVAMILDYNLYYSSSPSATAVRFGTTNYTTLLDWQTNGPFGAGYDANSVSGNPNFVNGLHIGSALPVDTATAGLYAPVAAILTTDIDGDPRIMGPRPDIGADERFIIANDAMAAALISPAGCGSAAQDVIVSVANVGTNNLISVPVTVNVTGDANASFNTTEPLIGSGTTVDINVGTINTAAGGTFNFEIIINANPDNNAANDTLLVTVNLLPSNQAALTMTGDNIVCDGNTAMVSATASYAPATIYWFDAATGGNLVHVGNSFTTPNLTTATTYYAEIQGCASPRALATVNLDTVGIDLDLGPDLTACGGQSTQIQSTVTLSTATSMVWSDGSQGTFIEALATGPYSATVTNANGCTDVDTVDVAFSPTPNVASNLSNVSCGGAGDGSIDLTVTGGSGPYTYLWSNSEVTQDLNTLGGGIYNVTITDNGTPSGCVYVHTFSISDPMPLAVNVDNVGPSCNGNDGTVDITVSGGTGTYTYNWSAGTTPNLEDATGLPAGTHTVTVTDVNGCTAVATGTLNAVTPISVTVDSVTDEMMAIAGSINTTIAGGSGSLQYLWNTGATTEDIAGLTAGTYTLTVTDLVTGCQTVTTVVVAYKIPDFVNNIPSLNAFKLYPNPTADKIWVNLTLAETTTVQLEVMSVTGQLLQSFEPRETLEQNYEVDMSNYPSGVYLARFVIGNEVMTTKVIVE